MTDPEEITQELQFQIDNGHARRMGSIENFFSIWQRQKMYKNFAIVAKFNRNIENDKVALFHALRTLFLQYPMLIATVNKTDYSDLSKPRPVHDYIKLHNTLKFSDIFIDIPDDIKNEKDKTTQLRKLNELHWSYEDDDLLWKLGFLDSHTLVYITNHCLSDGISGKYLFQSLLDLLNSQKPQTTQEKFDPDTQYLFNYNNDHRELPKLPPSLDSVISYTPPFMYFFEYLYNLLFIKKFSFQSDYQSTRDDVYKYRLINISSKDLGKIKSVLKVKETNSSKLTLTPYMQAVWLRTVNEFLTPIKNPILGIHDVSTPGDARQYIPPSIDSDQYRFGANTSGVHKFFYPVKKLTWDTVNYFNDYLKKLHAGRKFLYNIGILTLDFVANSTNMDSMLDDALMKSRRTGTLFSNIGVLQTNTDQNKEYDIDDIIFTSNAGASSTSFSVSVVSSNKGGANLLIAVTDNVIDDVTLDKMVEFFEKSLLDTESIED